MTTSTAETKMSANASAPAREETPAGADARPAPSTRVRSLFLVNLAAFLTLVGTTVTGLVLWLGVEKGAGAARAFWGLRRFEWGDLHLYFSLAFVALFMFHLLQHWRWIRAVAPRQAGFRAGLGGLARVLLTVALTLGIVWGLFHFLRREAGSGQGHGYGRTRQETDETDRNTGRGGGGGWGRDARRETQDAAASASAASAAAEGTVTERQDEKQASDDSESSGRRMRRGRHWSGAVE
jgi:hypothetical protein